MRRVLLFAVLLSFTACDKNPVGPSNSQNQWGQTQLQTGTPIIFSENIRLVNAPAENSVFFSGQTIKLELEVIFPPDMYPFQVEIYLRDSSMVSEPCYVDHNQWLVPDRISCSTDIFLSFWPFGDRNGVGVQVDVYSKNHGSQHKFFPLNYTIQKQ